MKLQEYMVNKQQFFKIKIGILELYLFLVLLMV